MYFINIEFGDFTLRYFVEVISMMGNAYFNSLVASLGAVALNVPLCLLAAYAFARFRFRAKATLYKMQMFIQSIPLTAGLIGFFVLFKTFRLLNNLFSLSIVGALSVIPINIWFATDYIKRIPKELEEAAKVDGASHLQVLRSITLPLATPLLVTMSLFAFITTWNEFIYAVVLITKGSLFTYPIALLALGTEAVTAPVGTYRWGFVAAGSFLGCLPILAVFTLFRRYLIEGLTKGALKA